MPLTDDEHGARGSLQRNSAHRQVSPPPVDGVLEHVPHAHTAGRLALLVNGGLDLVGLGTHVGALGPHALEGLDAVFEAALQDEPARGLGDEEHGDGDEDGDDVDYAEGDEVGGAVGALGGGPVDDRADERALKEKITVLVSKAI